LGGSDYRRFKSTDQGSRLYFFAQLSMHDTHYNPEFWGFMESENICRNEKIDAAMARARDYAIGQYKSVAIT
jgi:hypothetical protein